MNLNFLREAIHLSLENMQHSGGGPFGAVIVRDQQIIGRGWNTVATANDPTAHGEVNAIRDACAKLKTFSLAGCEIYSSCEPCPMCLASIYWARLDRIYYAAGCADAEAAGFADACFYKELALPKDQRRVPMVQGLRDEACSVFDEWVKKADRIRY